MTPGLEDFDRRLAALRQRHGALRDRLPEFAVRWLKAGRDGFKGVRTRLTAVEHPSPHANLFHCCVQKTGSTWIGALLSDLATYRHCGLRTHHYQSLLPGGVDPRPLPERSFPDGFPPRTIVSPLYVGYDQWARIPVAGTRRAFFVSRDPRDLLVSWYFSVVGSHVAVGEVPRLRAKLAALPSEEGLAAAAELLEGQGLFATLRSWARRGGDDPDVLLVRYEALSGPEPFATFRRLYDHLDVPIPDGELRDLVEAYGFRRLTGREPGQTDARSHLRSGRAGDWRNHFTPALAERFDAISEGLVAELGYGAEASGAGGPS